MMNFYKTIDSKIKLIDQIEDGCWINMINPTPEEIGFVINKLNIEPSFLNAALDEEESSRIESENGQTLIIVDAPITEQQTENTIMYLTMPVGIIISDKNIITVAIKEHSILNEIASGTVRNIQTVLKTRFVFILLLKIVSKFLQYLRQIDKIQSLMERQLQKSMRNKDLFQMLGLEKSLVYFSTALKANEVTLEKILRGRLIKLYEDDQDILEDVLIEIKQAIDMTSTYSSILSSTMDIFASIISNNLNIVMKLLTCVTVVLTIPNIITGFFGMNLKLPFQDSGYLGTSVVVFIIIFIMLVVWKMLDKMGMFKRF
ncbi:MAG: magnesium transporter CorA family protein [Oscillospiraceae bacterium]|nr:magnesium transporter CorA family protein [Oscillospiraceae bacterium]